MPAQILIVEDEPKIASLLSDYLVHGGYQTRLCGTGEEALDVLRRDPPEVVLLDLMLPGIDGLDVCKQLRTFSDVPVIMITARADEVDRLLGLELGADDYICKPFSPREVVARVRALLRRIQALKENGRADTGGLLLDENRFEASWQGQAVGLTVVEFALLKTLADHPGHIRSRQQLIDRIYNDNRVVSDRTVDSHIKKLRRKLADAFPEMEFIHSIYGAGYRFEASPANADD
ncbi:response regulator [Alcanivorax sp. S71-1-4]|uniref:response regulator n=1 Tax=Alcanivorax sp. S71-1-4 TaxID=1177159 RepID=UPI001356DF60|nr:response regulator [Alcanivorax sp. S71-1-4]KAF0808928.1 response regulator [Alcanivorax sp. S71-1-4]